MEVKITTLSLSARISEFPEILLCGFPGCVAPEVIERIGYGPEADIFSCGIIMYMITTGIFPFSALTINEILEKNIWKVHILLKRDVFCLNVMVC